MAGKFEDYLFDKGLTPLNTEATHIVICAAEPTTYTLASLANANVLGYQAFPTHGAFAAPSASSSPVGEKADSTAITQGTVQHTGNAAWWGTIDADNSRLLAHNTLTATLTVTVGGAFALPSFPVVFPSGA